MEHLVAVGALAVACAAWVVFQRWIAEMDPEQPGVEGNKGCCGSKCKGDSCKKEQA